MDDQLMSTEQANLIMAEARRLLGKGPDCWMGFHDYTRLVSMFDNPAMDTYTATLRALLADGALQHDASLKTMIAINESDTVNRSLLTHFDQVIARIAEEE